MEDLSDISVIRIHNGRWSDITVIRIPETTMFGGDINILITKMAVSKVVRDCVVTIGMEDGDLRELKINVDDL